MQFIILNRENYNPNPKRVIEKIDMTNGNLVDESITEILSVLEPQEKKITPVVPQEDIFFTACKIVAQYSGISISRPALTKTEKENDFVILKAIAQTSHFRFRKVKLTGDWWKFDNGALLGFEKTDSKPVALIPSKKEGYYIVDPKEGTRKKISSRIDATLLKEAYYFYPTLPDKKLVLRDLLNFVLPRNSYELKNLILLQLFISSAGLLIPVATGILFDYVVPNHDINALWQIVAALIVNTLVISTFSVSQVISLYRIKLRTNAMLQPAIWDRILSLPMTFFKKFTAGDLANRAEGIDSIQQELTDTFALTIVSGFLSLISIFLLFYFNILLGFITLLLVVILIIVSLIAYRKELTYQRKAMSLQGALTGLLLQLFNSIGKIRVSHAERRMFKLAIDPFVRKTRYFLKSGIIIVFQTVFNTMFGVVSLLIFFAVVIRPGTSLSFGNFIIFNAIFSQLFISLFGLVSAIAQIMRVIPLYERIKPILTTTSESFDIDVLKIPISGQIEIKNLSFRYHVLAPLVCDSISLEIKKGEWIAIVGPSAAGKSTLFRLLLGFETPESGSIFFDGHPLSQFDLITLRQQLGVVLQTSSLMPGTILENIIGLSSDLTIEDAWHVAHLANIDTEIKEMPMQMQTLITEGGKTISVGQRQRLLIARALAKKPKILLLDEAMSGLDDATQYKIQRNLEQLKITRIICTHRIQMIENADCIYVLDKGKVIKKGLYNDLLNSSDFFANLAKSSGM